MSKKDVNKKDKDKRSKKSGKAGNKKVKDGRGQHTGKGGHEPWKNSPVIRPYAEIENMPDGERRQFVSMTLEGIYKWYRMPKVETDDECEERLIYFFETCISTGEMPTVEKMALALGVVRYTVWRWERGDLGPRRSAMIKKAKEFISTYDAEMVSRGKMQPVAYIFRAKNYYGMQDKVEHQIAQTNPLDNISSPEEIADRINNSIPIEDYEVEEDE